MKRILLFITIFLFLGMTNVYASDPYQNINSINYSFDVPKAGDEIKNINTCTSTPSNAIKSCTGVWVVSDPNGNINDIITGYSEAKGVFLEDTTYYLLPIISLENDYRLDTDNPNMFKFNGNNGDQSITIANSKFTYSFNIYKVKIGQEKEKSVTISNIDIVDKSEKSETLYNPTYKGLNANLSAKFHNINDYIKYEITILNETNSYVKLNKSDIKSPNSDYVTYDYEIDNKAINPNSAKKIYVTMKYTTKKEISKDSCNNYVENNSTDIMYRDNIIENPQTSNYILISVLLVVIIISTTIITIKSKNKNIQMFMIIFSLSLIGIVPMTTLANDNNLKINTKVEIDNNQCTLKINGQCVRSEANIKAKDWYNQNKDLLESIDTDNSIEIPGILRYYDGNVTYLDGNNGNSIMQSDTYTVKEIKEH